MKRIAIQGELGSFHDITAHEYFQGEQIELICCATFEEVFENIKRDPTIIGICAIENTIAGSLLHNYELLRESGTTVVGEHKLHIEHSICCLPTDDWKHQVPIISSSPFLIKILLKYGKNVYQRQRMICAAITASISLYAIGISSITSASLRHSTCAVARI